VAIAVGLELSCGVAVAPGEEDALLVAVGLDEADVVAVPPHPTSANANETATRFDARQARLAVFMVSPI